MKKAFIALTMLVVLTSATILQAATLSTVSTQQSPFKNIQVSGNLTNGATGSFTGNLNITRFANQNGKLVAIGQLTGTITQTITDPVTGAVSTITKAVNQLVTLLVTPGNATCEILDLQLGPVDLDLLGLKVHLDQINLNITAEAGPGNLLGNLLCAVAGLLDRGGPLSGLAGLLNNILRVLG